MQKYIGTKIVQAEPAERDGRTGYKVLYTDGYESWSPSEAFEDAYRPAGGLPFGLAIEALKKRARVTRAGWNGKGMYLFMIGVPGSNDFWTYTNGKNDNLPLLPFIAMKTADDHVVPWLASQTDMLAEDWVILE